MTVNRLVSKNHIDNLSLLYYNWAIGAADILILLATTILKDIFKLFIYSF